MPVRYDEIWSVRKERIDAYFSRADLLGCRVETADTGERTLGSIVIPANTRVIIEGENAEEVHRLFKLNFLSVGG